MNLHINLTIDAESLVAMEHNFAPLKNDLLLRAARGSPAASFPERKAQN
jgi:hypothetical protein